MAHRNLQHRQSQPCPSVVFGAAPSFHIPPRICLDSRKFWKGQKLIGQANANPKGKSKHVLHMNCRMELDHEKDSNCLESQTENACEQRKSDAGEVLIELRHKDLHLLEDHQRRFGPAQVVPCQPASLAGVSAAVRT